MNSPNPLVPQGTYPDPRGKSRFRIAALTIGAVHLVVLGPLLFQGCKRTTEPIIAEPTNVASAYPAWEPATSPPPVTAVAPTGAVTTPSEPVPPAQLEPAPVAGTEHVVVKGDSFYTLGLKYKVSMKAIAEANPGVDSKRLKIGQKLNIPAPGAAPAAALASNGGSNGGEKTYTVKSNDNLLKIAKAHGVSVKALRSANNLRTDRIVVGQKLKIPAKATAPALEAAPTETPPPAPLPNP